MLFSRPVIDSHPILDDKDTSPPEAKPVYPPLILPIRINLYVGTKFSFLVRIGIYAIDSTCCPCVDTAPLCPFELRHHPREGSIRFSLEPLTQGLLPTFTGRKWIDWRIREKADDHVYHSFPISYTDCC